MGSPRWLTARANRRLRALDAMRRFTAERRERFLTLLETGRNVEEAAADVDVNPSTVARWAARGRAGASEESSEFARRFDLIRAGDGERLTEDDVIRALEGDPQGLGYGDPYLARSLRHRRQVAPGRAG
jgi:hypothetical protein